MEKKGQMTVFMILGLMVLIIISMIIFYTARPRKVVFQKHGADVINYIEQCLFLTSEEGFRILGLQGGHMTMPERYLTMPYGNFAYGYIQGRNKMPGQNNIKEEVQKYISENMEDCLGDFQSFPQYEITKGDDMHSEIIFSDKSTISFFTMPLSINTGDDKKILDEFSVELPLRFYRIYDLAYRVMDDLEAYPDIINLTLLENQDIDVNILTYNDSFVYVFEDKKSVLSDNMPYRLILGVERDG